MGLERDGHGGNGAAGRPPPRSPAGHGGPRGPRRSCRGDDRRPETVRNGLQTLPPLHATTVPAAMPGVSARGGRITRVEWPAGDRRAALPRGAWLAAVGVLVRWPRRATGSTATSSTSRRRDATRVRLPGSAARGTAAGSGRGRRQRRLIVLFRPPPAVATALTVLIGALTSRELGGSRADMVWTAVATALATAVVGVGHLFSTTTFDLTFVVLGLRPATPARGRRPGTARALAGARPRAALRSR